MHNINRAIKNSHVKTNLVYALHCIHGTSKFNVSKFTLLLTLDEIVAVQTALMSLKNNKLWYTFLHTKFLKYIHSVRSTISIENISKFLMHFGFLQDMILLELAQHVDLF